MVCERVKNMEHLSLGFKEDEKGRIWMPVTGSSSSYPCQHCTELTPCYFHKFVELGNGFGIMRTYHFCNEKCIENYKKEMLTL